MFVYRVFFFNYRQSQFRENFGETLKQVLFTFLILNSFLLILSTVPVTKPEKRETCISTTLKQVYNIIVYIIMLVYNTSI